VSRHAIYFGGTHYSLGTTNDTWLLTLADNRPSFTKVELDPRPAPRMKAAVSMSERERAMYVSGGFPFDEPGPKDTWRLRISGPAEGLVLQWEQLHPNPDIPWSVSGGVGVFAGPTVPLAVVLGGSVSGDDELHRDVWLLARKPNGAFGFVRANVACEPPEHFGVFAAIHDPERDWVLIFGGFERNGNQSKLVSVLENVSALEYQNPW
jgi:hypothetical protein